MGKGVFNPFLKNPEYLQGIPNPEKPVERTGTITLDGDRYMIRVHNTTPQTYMDKLHFALTKLTPHAWVELNHHGVYQNHVPHDAPGEYSHVPTAYGGLYVYMPHKNDEDIKPVKGKKTYRNAHVLQRLSCAVFNLNLANYLKQWDIEPIRVI
jgi:hypothetical protein